MKNQKAIIIGLSGEALTSDEIYFIQNYNPWGVVLFSRNIKDASQLKKLLTTLKEITYRQDLPIFVDQEGGRVQRLRPPLAPNYPPAADFGKLYQQDKQKGIRAAWLVARLIAYDLHKYGFTADFMPLLDVPVKGSHDVIGDRAYSIDKDAVAALGASAADGLRAGGLLAVMKHIPGHGRAFTDTHKEPARVDADKQTLIHSDFTTFKALSQLPAAMTAHIIYDSYDKANPATLSKTVIDEVIRHEIGFEGLLMSDDLSMQALPGTLAQRAKASFKAGCDLALHCNGNMEEMEAIIAETPYLEGKSLERTQQAEKWITTPQKVDESVMREELAMLMSGIQAIKTSL